MDMKTFWQTCFLAGALLMAGCSDDDTPKNVVLTGGTQTSQTVYADETQGAGGGISFTAAADWTATVTDVTATKAAGGSTVDWLTLSAYSGGPGEYTLTLTLTENNTGADRKAKIEIVCGGDVIVITVEQKGTTEAGDTPAGPAEPEGGKYLVARIDEEGSSLDGPAHKNVYYFEYDNQGRIAQVTTDDGGEGKEEDMYRITYEFGGNTITGREYFPTWDDPTPGGSEYASTARTPFRKTKAVASEDVDVTTFTLGENGYIASFTYEWYDGDEVLAGNGTLEYDEEGYLIAGSDKYSWSYGSWGELLAKGDWRNGNLMRVTLEDIADNTAETAEMTYDNPAYVNNPEVNIDLTWIICDSYALSCFPMEGGGGLNAFGYMGKRGRLMMTHEYDRVSYGSDTQYTYEYDDLGRPAKVVKKCVSHEGHGEPSSYTYTITYAE